jgi:hypothetical protein
MQNVPQQPVTVTKHSPTLDPTASRPSQTQGAAKPPRRRTNLADDCYKIEKFFEKKASASSMQLAGPLGRPGAMANKSVVESLRDLSSNPTADGDHSVTKSPDAESQAKSSLSSSARIADQTDTMKASDSNKIAVGSQTHKGQNADNSEERTKPRATTWHMYYMKSK